MDNKSQHKVAKRECPQCRTEKSFPERNETCSAECAYALRATRSGKLTQGESHEKAGDSWIVSLPKTTIRTLDELIAHCKIDTAVWEVERFVVNKWEMASVPRSTRKDGNGKWARPSTKPVVTQLFQVKAWLRRNAQKVAIEEEIAALKEDAKRVIEAPAPAIIAPKSGSGVMIELSIPDLHMGKLSWAKETGYTNYDSTIAANLFRESVSTLIERTKSHKAERVCLVIGNDLLNSDNIQNTTTRGTPQHSDVRYQKTFRSTRLMVTDAINEVRRVAEVDVIMVPGNHDTLSVWHLGDSLECLFSGHPGVNIENQPTQRKYCQWGKVMLMWTHGDKGKHANYPLLMATEQREMFGATTWREIHLGHLHQVQLREQNGVRVRILPALCAPDAWHSEMGYVGNVRSAEAYVWHREEGLIGTAIYVAPDNAERTPTGRVYMKKSRAK